MIRGIAVQVEHLNGKSNASLSLDDYFGMVQFGLALGGQIRETEKTSTGKVIAENAIGCALGGFYFFVTFGVSFFSRLWREIEQIENKIFK